ncbi:MAG TPA: HDOD domain-containing protein [Methylomirabilota bacterium]|nr:HDOD domain-containing protein [Methylomirabilota bacterium]
MTVSPADSPVAVAPLDREQIERRLKTCARLPSLGSINSALRELLNADQRYTSQVAEIIRRDPSLTARLLRLVNSVYYGLSTPVNSIEEAVFYLGVRHIRQLAMVTPIIEDFQKLVGGAAFPWREFWQHCIGTAILTREVMGHLEVPGDEADYVGGLVHDVGKIAMAAAFPEHFRRIYREEVSAEEEWIAVETRVLGMDHAELGALYLRNHNLPDVLVDVARYHHQPERASHHGPIIAAVHIADLLVRFSGIGRSGNPALVREEDWLNAPAWGILFPEQTEEEQNIARTGLRRSLDRLPLIMEGLV